MLENLRKIKRAFVSALIFLMVVVIFLSVLELG